MLEIENRYREMVKHDRIRIENWVTLIVDNVC